mmetsp:Transcript_12055/g.31537  ORF Transcript_12055/g.31537 Transcript_12055/m.31537 type:complete len:257 (-) Transcript_12055:509-1279(-)
MSPRLGPCGLQQELQAGYAGPRREEVALGAELFGARRVIARDHVYLPRAQQPPQALAIFLVAHSGVGLEPGVRRVYSERVEREVVRRRVGGKAGPARRACRCERLRRLGVSHDDVGRVQSQCRHLACHLGEPTQRGGLPLAWPRAEVCDVLSTLGLVLKDRLGLQLRQRLLVTELGTHVQGHACSRNNLRSRLDCVEVDRFHTHLLVYGRHHDVEAERTGLGKREQGQRIASRMPIDACVEAHVDAQPVRCRGPHV